MVGNALSDHFDATNKQRNSFLKKIFFFSFDFRCQGFLKAGQKL